ncbi:unnamed protein product, partial [Polarella glacialis]
MEACSVDLKPREALALLMEVRLQGLRVNVAAQSAATKSAGHSGRWDWALALLADARQNGLADAAATTLSTLRQPVLIACEKAARWQLSLSLFQEDTDETLWLRPDLFSRAAVIAACGRGGEWQRALELLHEVPRRYGHSHWLGHRVSDAVPMTCSSTRPSGRRWGYRSPPAGREHSGSLGSQDDNARQALAAFSAAAHACKRASRWEQALSLLDALRWSCLQPDLIMCDAVLGACASVSGEWRR